MWGHNVNSGIGGMQLMTFSRRANNVFSKEYFDHKLKSLNIKLEETGEQNSKAPFIFSSTFFASMN